MCSWIGVIFVFEMICILKDYVEYLWNYQRKTNPLEMGNWLPAMGWVKSSCKSVKVEYNLYLSWEWFPTLISKCYFTISLAVEYTSYILSNFVPKWLLLLCPFWWFLMEFVLMEGCFYEESQSHFSQSEQGYRRLILVIVATLELW